MTALKIFLRTLLILIGVIVLILVILLAYYYGTYENELKAIKKSLNQIEGVEVVNIWGHEDIELEEISARINVKNKGEIVLYGLSKDSFRYPYSVDISEIDGLSFSIFTCSGSMGVGGTIDIGTESRLGRLMPKAFNSPEDVIENYDTITAILKKIKDSSELGHFVEESFEQFIFVHDMKSQDKDPIFNLINAEGEFKFAKTLNWINAKCKE